ncbi:hypothetical protein L798_15210 [Zootermopsis nevadensis]|uniref:Uncharacterized protein n=1 Tax=Zootermopsis nevadensis TaxID=136037 RepID=A0A067RJH3_ZOONE|nr:hypothetical protein L798_15210 [Zootermopsis nevadensis]
MEFAPFTCFFKVFEVYPKESCSDRNVGKLGTATAFRDQDFGIRKKESSSLRLKPEMLFTNLKVSSDSILSQSWFKEEELVNREDGVTPSSVSTSAVARTGQT